MQAKIITIETKIKANPTQVWEHWTKPKHITQWNFATEEWSCPTAINDLSPGGQLNWRMEAKDGSMGFDFIGTYQEIVENEYIAYEMSDGRKVTIEFKAEEDGILLKESFEAEGTNSDEQQRAGWQAILNNFKAYVESNVK